MNKSELRNGMRFKMRNTYNFLILNSEIYLETIDGYEYSNKLNHFLSSYNNDMTNLDDDKYDIIEVYNIDGKLIWERDEIDWSKVPKDTKVLVKNKTDKLWYPRYFVEYKNGKYNTYINGSTSWSTDDFPEEWDYCKLVEEQKEEITLEELIQEHDELHKSCDRNCMSCKYDGWRADCMLCWILDNYKVIRK